MTFTPTPIGNSTYELIKAARKVALLVMDYMGQVDEVVLLPGITDEEKHSVLQLALSHAIQYVVDRQYSGGILRTVHRSSLDRARSHQLLTEELAESVKDMVTPDLIQYLENNRIPVITAVVNSVKEALEKVLSDPRVTVPVTYTLSEQLTFHQTNITFQVEAPAKFRAWNTVGKPGEPFDLYIIPRYHPDWDDNKRSEFLINGATNALIRGKAILYVKAPQESDDDESAHLLSTSWSRMKHPFRAEGSQLTASISPTQILSVEGLEEATIVLMSFLELDNNYMSVSGATHGPYTYPQNIVSRQNMRIDSFEGKARGSEGFCVWAYQILQAEGSLGTAYIPSWFEAEGWLDAYKSAGSSAID